MMLPAQTLLLLAAAGLAALPASAAPAKSAVPPDGYWIVATSEGDAGLVGAAFRFRKDGWDLFTAKGEVKRVDSRWSGDGRRWTEAGDGPERLSLERRDKDLALSFGRARARLQPAPAARAAELARAGAGPGTGGRLPSRRGLLQEGDAAARRGV